MLGVVETRLAPMVADAARPADRDLWARVAESDDADAFAVLFDRHASAVYNYAFRRTSDWSAAEEVVAMSFLEAWRRRGAVELTHDSALPWLLGVATNVLRNLARGRRRYGDALRRLEPDAGTGWGEQEVVDRMAAERASSALVGAVAALPNRHRDVVWLCLVEGLSYREAADALGIAVGTVRSRLARARERLRADERLEPLWRSGHDMG